MPLELALRINGRQTLVPAGISVAAALARLGAGALGRDLADPGRTACCGMGVCFECRVRIDGVERLGCLTRVAPGMEIICRD